MKTSGFQRGLVKAPQPRPPGCLVTPGDIFISQLGGGWRMGGGFSIPLRTEQPPQQRTTGPRVSVVLKQRDLAMSSAHLREVC